MSLRKNTLTVAVVGATGTQGGAVVDALLQNGHHVRALTRDAHAPKAQALAAKGVEVYQYDSTDAASLLPAFNGADAVFGMTTPFGTSPETEVIYGKILVDAAIKANVKHFVFTSAANANLQTGIPHFDSKYEVEKYLQASGLDWTIIGPAAFMDDFIGGWYKHSLDEGKLVMVMPADRKLQFVCSQDIAAMAVYAFEHVAQMKGQRVDIAGDVLTPNDIAELFAKKLHRDITFEEVPLDVAETYSTDLAAMFRYFQNVGLNIDVPKLRAKYPEIVWHTFAEWLASSEL